MLATTQSTALVPLSLSLVQKKEASLQTEKRRLDKRLKERTTLLHNLRESHEHILITNGQLQERSRVHKETLLALQEVLESKQLPGDSENHGVNELEATKDKCDMLREVLAALAEKHSTLERRALELVDKALRDAAVVETKTQKLNEARDTLQLQQEDGRSAQWSFDMDQDELTKDEKKLDQTSLEAQREGELLEELKASGRAEQDTLEEVRTIVQNYQGMAQEELRQLTIANESAKSAQQDLRKQLDSNGATCAEDDEVLQLSQELQSKLQHLNEDMSEAKFAKRELALRTKQEKDMLTLTATQIKAKDEQLSWLERQHVHLVNEQKEMKKAYAQDEAAYQEFVATHTKEMDSLAAEIKAAEKQVKTVDRAITAKEKKVAAVNKKIAQRKKVLATWDEKVRERQEELTRSTATRELVDSEVQGLAQALEQEQRSLQLVEQKSNAREMQVEDLLSTCSALEADIFRTDKQLTAMQSDLTAAETSVKNRVDEIRDKFLDSFVISEAANLIEMLNNEVQCCSKADTDEFERFEATFNSKATMLKERYDALLASTRAKYSKVLEEKETQYKENLETLQTRKKHMEQRAEGLAERSSKLNASDGDEKTSQDSLTSLAEFDPPWIDGGDSECAIEKVPSVKQRLSVAPSKSKQSQRKTKTAPYQVSKPVRHRPSTERNLERKSAAEDKLTRVTAKVQDLSSPTYHDGAWPRRPRLQRRTAEQKAGKVAKPARRELYAASASTPPGAVVSAPTTSSSARNLHADVAAPVEDNVAGGKDPMDSPIGCDVAIEALDPTQTAKLKTAALPAVESSAAAASAIVKRGATKKARPELAGQRGKGPTKRTTSKVSHRQVQRTKKPKARRISLSSQAARTVDWSATDSFSFA